jgi:hypothetical protein
MHPARRSRRLRATVGDYLLFLVSDAGVPSIAKHVRVTR